MASELDWQKMFGFGDPVTVKTGFLTPTSVGTLVPVYDLNRINASSSGGLIIANITAPYTGFTGCLYFMPASSAAIVMSSSGIIAAGNIKKGYSMQEQRVNAMYYDGASWFPLGASSS